MKNDYEFYIFGRSGYVDQCITVDSQIDILNYIEKGFSVKRPTVEEKVRSLIDDYNGTCNSLSSEDQEWLEENDKIHDFYGEIFECTSCGWWYEISEQGESDSGEQVCQNCSEEYED